MAGVHHRKRPKLTIPSYPSGDSEGMPYIIHTAEEKCVGEYAGMTMLQVLGLDYFSFRFLLRDAVIYNHSQSKKGREWLKNAHRLTQTEPDLPALRTKFGKEGGNGSQ